MPPANAAQYWLLSGKLQRLDKTRLATEFPKLDPTEERSLPGEGMPDHRDCQAFLPLCKTECKRLADAAGHPIEVSP